MDFRHTSPSEKMKVLQHNTAWLNNSWKGRVAVSRSHSMFSFTQRSRHLSHQANSRCVWGSQMPALPSSWQIIFSISVSVLADGWCWSYRVLTHSTCQTIKFSCQRLTGPCPRGLTSLTTSYVWSEKLCWASSDTSIYTNKLLTFADLAKKSGVFDNTFRTRRGLLWVKISWTIGSGSMDQTSVFTWHYLLHSV